MRQRGNRLSLYQSRLKMIKISLNERKKNVYTGKILVTQILFRIHNRNHDNTHFNTQTFSRYRVN